jgi:hypothetical protein
MISMVPPDLFAIVHEILETCTVPDFCLFLQTLTTNATLNGRTLSVEELLNKSEEHYQILIHSKKWNILGTTTS